MSSSEQAKLDYAHNVLASHLDEIKKEFPRFPNLTVIIRDPALPETHIVVSNEPADIADALTNIVRVPK